MRTFRYDLFIRDFRAAVKKDIRTLQEIANDCNMTTLNMHHILNGKTKKPQYNTILKILKYMNPHLYYGFYVEKD